MLLYDSGIEITLIDRFDQIWIWLDGQVSSRKNGVNFFKIFIIFKRKLSFIFSDSDLFGFSSIFDLTEQFWFWTLTKLQAVFEIIKSSFCTHKSIFWGNHLGWDKNILGARLFQNILTKNKKAYQNKSHIFLSERFS